MLAKNLKVRRLPKAYYLVDNIEMDIDIDTPFSDDDIELNELYAYVPEERLDLKGFSLVIPNDKTRKIINYAKQVKLSIFEETNKQIKIHAIIDGDGYVEMYSLNIPSICFVVAKSGKIVIVE